MPPLPSSWWRLGDPPLRVPCVRLFFFIGTSSDRFIGTSSDRRREDSQPSPVVRSLGRVKLSDRGAGEHFEPQAAINMNRLQLATLLSWAGNAGFQGRKRLQKVIYFLQAAGCPLDCRYTLHHFGPYSRDVADRCDEMVAAGLISEKGGPTQYDYTLTEATKSALAQTPDAVMRKFQSLGNDLINRDLWSLELGSTILYFYRSSHDWNQALNDACLFKKVATNVKPSLRALELAQQFETPAVS